MTLDVEKEIQEYKINHTRINKLLAERDPLYEQKYQDKRRLIQAEILAAQQEVKQAHTIWKNKDERYTKLLQKLVVLDIARKNWEGM